MNTPLPDQNTKAAYSEFISKWKPAVEQKDREIDAYLESASEYDDLDYYDEYY